ncbi:Beta-glucosidase 27 [Linum grandiflorum]
MKASQKGMIGVTLNSMWMLNPIIRGEYPKSMKKLVRERLPKFTPEQSKVLKGSIDFLGVNYYTSRFAGYIPDKFPPDFKFDSGVFQTSMINNKSIGKPVSIIN